mgnify:CR=1 FL=1
MNSMQNKPLVSVVIPTYRRPYMITRAVDSVLNQTYQHIEIFVVDDNDSSSTERKATEEIMAQYESNLKATYLQHEVLLPETLVGVSQKVSILLISMMMMKLHLIK